MSFTLTCDPNFVSFCAHQSANLARTFMIVLKTIILQDVVSSEALLSLQNFSMIGRFDSKVLPPFLRYKRQAHEFS